MKNYIQKYKSLGDETRVRILKIFLMSEQSLCVCEIMDALNLPAYTISKHLKELKNADLIDEKKDGKFIMYSLLKTDDVFVSNLLGTVKAIPEELFENEKENLQKRLSARIDGKCVVGINTQS